MQYYVIEHRDGGYLSQTSNGKWQRTAKFENATQLSYEKASNVLNNCIGPNFRDVWSIVEISNPVEYKASSGETEEYDFDWNFLSSTHFKLYNDLNNYGNKLNSQLSDVDLEICDIQHYIEFFSLDAARGYKAYRMLKERLERRRRIKDEMARVKIFLSGIPGDFATGKVSQQLHAVDNSSYRPRILNELFGLDSKSIKLPHVS